VTGNLKREVLALVILVLGVDAIFVAAYFLAQVQSTSDSGKVVFTAVWTLVTLGVVIRGLSRVRRARLGRPGTAED
jgi:uncharacterized membrane protein YidH (DUF202 family)